MKTGVDIRIEGVNLSYGTNHVLKDVSLEIKPGELFAFLGPSGCGKTTLLRLIAGFNQADTGRVMVAGSDISHLPPWKRDVGMVFQSYALWPHMNVRRNVAFGLEERRVKSADIARRVAAALELVDLTGYAERKPSQLSGGQQQRVALARTLVVEPKVLLLDEPLSNLDAKLRTEVRRELRDLQRRLGLTTIFVTHDQEEANSICDRIAVMNAGVVQQVGTPMELYENPRNLFVANFLGTANIIDGRIGGGAYELADGTRVPVTTGQAAAGSKLVFRPQSATLTAERTAAAPGWIALTGTVAHREFLGASVRYGVRVAGGEIAVDLPFHANQTLFAVDEKVRIGLNPSALAWLSD
jgi:iron(III) transport system ATP-binding protein